MTLAELKLVPFCSSEGTLCALEEHGRNCFDSLHTFASTLRERTQEMLQDPNVDELLKESLELQVMSINGVKVLLDRVDEQQTMTLSEYELLKRQLRRAELETNVLKRDIESLRRGKEMFEQEAQKEKLMRENAEREAEGRIQSLKQEGEARVQEERVKRESEKKKAEERMLSLKQEGEAKVREEKWKRERAEKELENRLEHLRQEFDAEESRLKWKYAERERREWFRAREQERNAEEQRLERERMEKDAEARIHSLRLKLENKEMQLLRDYTAREKMDKVRSRYREFEVREESFREVVAATEAQELATILQQARKAEAKIKAKKAANANSPEIPQKSSNKSCEKTQKKKT